MANPVYMTPTQLLEAMRDPAFAAHYSFLVMLWPDGDRTCVLTKSRDEREFRQGIGYELCTRTEFVRHLQAHETFQAGEPRKPRIPYGKQRGHPQRERLAPVVSGGVPYQSRAYHGTHPDERQPTANR